MVPKASIAVPTADGAQALVRSAWSSVGGPSPTAVETLREVGRLKPALYRLIFKGRPSVYAKRSPTTEMGVERMVYEQVLSRLALTVPRCLGSCREADGVTWLFIEEVGDRSINEQSPEHRRLAGRWLGRLHCAGAADPPALTLPDVGAVRYRGRLHAAREGICRNLGNRALGEGDRAVLCGVLGQLEALESRWHVVERACEGLPVTLVHGDFRAKNVRIGGPESEPILYTLDWEMAGWGIPAADLASAFQRVMTISIDRAAYLEVVRERWSDLDEPALRRLAILGRMFQLLAGAEWSSASLIFESERYLMRPIVQLGIYRRHLTDVLEDGAKELGWS